MELKVKLTTEYYGEDWGDGEASMSGESINATLGDEKASYKVCQGEPEDMIFGRDLQELDSVIKLMEMAYECGLKNGKMSVELIEERG